VNNVGQKSILVEVKSLMVAVLESQRGDLYVDGQGVESNQEAPVCMASMALRKDQRRWHFQQRGQHT
jgi:hypothetical protein